MKRTLRIGLATAALGLVLALAGPSAARAQVSFFGRFPLPHGSLSIGVGSPAYPIGSYVPYGYARQIQYLPDYGYGFYCDSGEWIPVEQYGTRWIVVETPVVRGFAPYGRRSDGFRRFDDRRFDDRRFDRFDRRFDQNRRFGTDDRRFDGRRDGRRYR